MSLIVRTPRSLPTLALDAVLTLSGWLIFAYLAGMGAYAVLDGASLQPVGWLFGDALPTGLVLLLYLSLLVFNALLLTLWGTYHKRFTRMAPSNPRDPFAIQQDQAQRFALSLPQLHDIKESRSLVFHHTDNGDISRWEGSDTHALRHRA